jgi:hypothetical protein
MPMAEIHCTTSDHDKLPLAPTVQANEGVKAYYKRYLGRLLDAPMDEELLAVHLNLDIDGWEQHGDHIGDPLWPEYVGALRSELAAVRAKIAGRMH